MLLTLLLTLWASVAFAQPESYYSDLFCKDIGGEREVRYDDGTRSDCQTCTRVYEVEFGPKWYEGIGQSLHYSIKSDRKPGVLIVEEGHKYYPRVCAVSKEYNLRIRVAVMRKSGKIFHYDICPKL